MNSYKHGRKSFLLKGCTLLLMSCFWVGSWGTTAFAQEEGTVEIYSIVTLEEGQTLEALARIYKTTRDQILWDNPKTQIKAGAILTIREKTVDSPAVETISRGATQGWGWPANAVISSDYGYRNGQFHHGIDLAIPHGTDIVAARAGKIAKAQWIDIYGLTVIIDHGNGVQSLYAHNQKLMVRAGDWVEQGEQVAVSGSTGRSTGPHLHFEIRLNGKALDPKPYLPKKI